VWGGGLFKIKEEGQEAEAKKLALFFISLSQGWALLVKNLESVYRSKTLGRKLTFKLII
jgi:hypothetical protein